MILELNGVPESYLHNFFQDVDGLSLKDVNQAAAHMIRPEDMQVVIYTDYSKTREQIESLGWPLKLN
jgi:predicted Zn-dependent peptidase